MSTWISSAGVPAAVLAVMLGLAGCVQTGTRAVALGEGASTLRLVPPAGFCAAESSVRRDAGAGFAAFTRCTPGATASPVLTATVGTPGSAGTAAPDPAAVAAFVTSPQGRRALAVSGDAAAVTVHEVLASGDAVLIRLTDRSPRAPGEGPGWRLLAPVAGRLVTLSATGGRGAPLPPAEARALAEAFLAALRRANG
jgi:hypothetical protein